jgi:hypothetical protein
MLTREGFGSDLAAGQPATTPSDHSADLQKIDGILNPKPVKTDAPNGGGAGGKKTDAAKETGGVIQALGSLSNTQNTGQQTSQNSQTTNQASQSAANTTQFSNGTITWDSLRSAILSGIVTGTGLYSNSANPVSVSCTGCSGSATTYFMMMVDFGAKTIGDSGASSCIHLTDAGGTTDQLFSSAISFASLTGPATISLSGHLQNATTTGVGYNGAGATQPFQNSTVTLQNAGGVPAKIALVNAVFLGSTSSSTPVTFNATYSVSR